MSRIALRDTLQMLVNAGVVARADAVALCESLARSSREVDVAQEVEEYRDAVASQIEAVGGAIV